MMKYREIVHLDLNVMKCRSRRVSTYREVSMARKWNQYYNVKADASVFQ